MSDLVGNPEVRFSRVAAQMLDCLSQENENMGFVKNNKVKAVMSVLLPNTQFGETN